MKAARQNKKGSTPHHFSARGAEYLAISDRMLKSGGGFTLIETLVAITILLVALVAPMTIIAKGMKSAFYAREQTTAFYLAQEGIELAFNYRAEDTLDGGSTWGWMSNMNSDLGEDCTSGSGCAYPVTNIAGETFATDYTRTIFVEEVEAGREVRVRTVVSWESGLFNATQQVELETSILDQYDWIN